MFPISTKGGGSCFGFPDICKVPAPPAPFIPTPFPNVAQCAQADAGTCAQKVKIMGKVTIVKGSEITRSSGDEAGTLKGMISSTNMGVAKYKMGSNKVKFEGKEVCHLTVTVGQNGGSNANVPAGMHVAPSQPKVLVG